MYIYIYICIYIATASAPSAPPGIDGSHSRMARQDVKRVLSVRAPVLGLCFFVSVKTDRVTPTYMYN